MSSSRSVEEILRELGYGSLYDKPREKPDPTYCIFCKDAPEHDLWEYGGCKCCGNNGYYGKA